MRANIIFYFGARVTTDVGNWLLLIMTSQCRQRVFAVIVILFRRYRKSLIRVPNISIKNIRIVIVMFT